MKHRTLFTTIICLITIWLASCSTQTPELTGETMGTTYSIVVPKLKKSDQTKLQNQIEASLARVNSAMSTYDPKSSISTFNSLEVGDWFAVTPDFAAVLQAALDIAKESDGAFDPTVGPVVSLWGFGAKVQQKVPQADAISNIMNLVNYQNLAIDSQGLAIRKQLPKLKLDLNAIAKGYGVDQLADVVESFGYRNYLVEIGGELRVSGKNAKGKLWRVGVERPSANGALTTQGLTLSEGGVATSGDYRNAFESDGRRYSHIIDARTGYPVEHNLASVTVVAESAMLADGWATALMVLGPEQGMEVAQRNALACLFIVRDGTEFALLESPEYSKLHSTNGQRQ